MFVGFIAVVVILLIIVGLMSTGATSGSGGVDQTKATKAISEISALAQSVGFYKTTVDTSNYKDMTVQALVDAGIVPSASTDNIVAADFTIENKADGTTASIADGEKIVVSKAVPGVVYKVVTDTAATGGSGLIDSDNYFDISVAVNTNGLTTGLKQALDTTYTKLHANVDGDTTTGEPNDTANDGKDDNGVKSGTVGDDYIDSDATDGAEIIVFN